MLFWLWFVWQVFFTGKLSQSISIAWVRWACIPIWFVLRVLSNNRGLTSSLFILLSMQVMLKMKSRHVAGTITKKKKSKRSFLSTQSYYKKCTSDLKQIAFACRCGTGSLQGYFGLAGPPFAGRRRTQEIFWVEDGCTWCHRVWVQKSERIWCMDTGSLQAPQDCWGKKKMRIPLNSQQPIKSSSSW